MNPDALPSNKPTVDAGAFGAWLAQTRAALRGEGGVEVPCGACVGCCISSYPIPLRPTDKRAIDEVPIEYYAHTPSGQIMMIPREGGTCPMFNSGLCTIYDARPQTCRDYDCRVFAAAGIAAGGPERTVINRRVEEWRFSYEGAAERELHDAIRRAAAFIRDKGPSFPGRVPTAPTGIAVLAIKTYEVFLRPDIAALSDADIAQAIVEANRNFDAGIERT
jgi:Fe-S-cluster containining protein